MICFKYPIFDYTIRMAYNETYTAEDLAPVTIDFMVGIGAVIVSFVAVIGLIILWKWVKGKKFM